MLLSYILLFATLWSMACQAPLSMGFSRQEYWSGLPCPPPGDLPDPRIELKSPTSPALVQFSSVAHLYLTLCDPMNCSTPGLPVHHQLPEFTQTHVHRVSDAIQPSCPLSSVLRPLLLQPSIFPSVRVFSSESALPIRWPNYWSCSFNISPTSEHPGLISFRTDGLDLLAVQETLKSLQHHSSKA